MAVKVKTAAGSVIGRIPSPSSVTSLTPPISAETAVTVPAYIVGANELSIYIDGLRCSNGREYRENGTSGATSTSVKFTSAISTAFTVDVVVG